MMESTKKLGQNEDSETCDRILEICYIFGRVGV